METPLTLRHIAERAERLSPDREVVSRTAGETERSTYGELCERARRLAAELGGLGMEPGDRVAKWWLPDEVNFMDEIPKTSVGKFDKKVLRARRAAE